MHDTSDMDYPLLQRDGQPQLERAGPSVWEEAKETVPDWLAVGSETAWHACRPDAEAPHGLDSCWLAAQRREAALRVIQMATRLLMALESGEECAACRQRLLGLEGAGEGADEHLLAYLQPLRPGQWKQVRVEMAALLPQTNIKGYRAIAGEAARLGWPTHHRSDLTEVDLGILCVPGAPRRFWWGCGQPGRISSFPTISPRCAGRRRVLILNSDSTPTQERPCRHALSISSSPSWWVRSSPRPSNWHCARCGPPRRRPSKSARAATSPCRRTMKHSGRPGASGKNWRRWRRSSSATSSRHPPELTCTGPDESPHGAGAHLSSPPPGLCRAGRTEMAFPACSTQERKEVFPQCRKPFTLRSPRT